MKKFGAFKAGLMWVSGGWRAEGERNERKVFGHYYRDLIFPWGIITVFSFYYRNKQKIDGLKTSM